MAITGTELPPVFFDDETLADNYQLEVYQFAKEICEDLHL
jgi:hypothetical protein